MSSMREVRRPTVADFEHAWRVVREWLPPTPLLGGGDGGPALKLETFQPTGAFKVRGALAAVARLERAVPIVTASAGNHGAGVAHAASLFGHDVTVVTATTASAAKVEAIKKYAVRLVQIGTTYHAAEAYALSVAGEGSYYLSPYNDPYVIAGQATIGHELDAQVSGPMTVVCPVGGGGLASGLGLWAANRPDVRIVGVEAANNPAVSAAVKAGAVVDIPLHDTVADALSGSLEPGTITVPVIAETVHDLVTVTEDEIRAGIRYLVKAFGVVAEGAGATAVAACLAGKVPQHGMVVAIVSGRNIAISLLGEILN
jgi:threonine dehydratase